MKVLSKGSYVLTVEPSKLVPRISTITIYRKFLFFKRKVYTRNVSTDFILKKEISDIMLQFID